MVKDTEQRDQAAGTKPDWYLFGVLGRAVHFVDAADDVDDVVLTSYGMPVLRDARVAFVDTREGSQAERVAF